MSKLKAAERPRRNRPLKNQICVLCSKVIEGYSHNPWPLCEESDFESRCCEQCNAVKVIPGRLKLMGFQVK